MPDRLIVAGFELPRFVTSIDPSLVWTAAILFAVGYAIVHARRSGIKPGQTYWLCVWALLGGLWGAHLLRLLADGSDGDSLAWLRFWNGGKSYFGGIFGGTLTAAIYLRARGLSFLKFADALAPAILLGYSFGRVGCFINGCDFGTLSNLPWAVQYPSGTEVYALHLARGLVQSTSATSLAVHPVQLYSAVLALCLFIFLSRLKARATGLIFGTFAIGYGAMRFALEFWRGGATADFGPFSIPQVCSLVLFLFGLCLCFGLHRRDSGTSRVRFARFWRSRQQTRMSFPQ